MAAIAAEVRAFCADLRETKCGFINISDGPPFQMTRAAARRLLLAVDTQMLSQDAAVYVADCIVASDSIEFTDEPTREAISFLEDDSNRFIDGNDCLWTHDEISRVLASLD